ncbi:MAG: CNNM domain-containing protein [Deltaproteobacteria bacterium]|nr:CNNM domain-containing protein [Deltaproteobacteria bacterium]
MSIAIWLGIGICVTQSAMFSGLNLAFFSISRLRLHAEVAQNNRNAKGVLAARDATNFLLTTILWGNVGINVLLTLLSNSVMAAVAAFVFSTFIITFLGEILPQAYFSRHALKMAALLLPLLRFYQVLLYPLAKSTALVLDRWLGKEAIPYFRERDLEEIIKMHILSAESEIDHVEGRGALNFLSMDDVPVRLEGEQMDPKSIISISFEGTRPVFPQISSSTADPFLTRLQVSGKKWVVITDTEGEPRLVVNADGLLRAALFDPKPLNPFRYCHRPIIVKNEETSLGDTIPRFKVRPKRSDDDVVDEDIIIYWGEDKRVITGADILGRLLRGIAHRQPGLYVTKDMTSA